MAGAGYKLFNTGDVLTAAQVNTYLQEQTVMVFADSAARTTALSGVLAEGMMSYLQDTNAVEVYNGSNWVGVSGAGDVTEVQAGTGISVASGTGPIPVVTNTMATEIDAKGDLIVGTGADTFDRLAVGTDGYTLVADSVETTGLKWAAPASGGGLTLINTGGTTLSGSSVTISSIPGTYRNLYIVITNFRPANDGNYVYCRVNGDAGSNRYYSTDTATGSYSSGFNSTQWQLTAASDDTVAEGISVYEIYEYANASIRKMITGYSFTNNDTTTANISYRSQIGFYNQTTAITSLDFKTFSGNFTSGTVYVYGVQ